MSLLARVRAVLGLRFPRVSGDEPLRQVKVVCHLEFSPRERG